MTNWNEAHHGKSLRPKRALDFIRRRDIGEGDMVDKRNIFWVGFGRLSFWADVAILFAEESTASEISSTRGAAISMPSTVSTGNSMRFSASLDSKHFLLLCFGPVLCRTGVKC